MLPFPTPFCSCCRLLFWNSRSFVHVPDETSQNTLLCDILRPADHSTKASIRLSLRTEPAIELRDGRNDTVAFSCRNKNKIIKRDSATSPSLISLNGFCGRKTPRFLYQDRKPQVLKRRERRACLVTLPTQLMKIKMAHTTAHLNAESFWWWQCNE